MGIQPTPGSYLLMVKLLLRSIKATNISVTGSLRESVMLRKSDTDFDIILSYTFPVQNLDDTGQVWDVSRLSESGINVEKLHSDWYERLKIVQICIKIHPFDFFSQKTNFRQEFFFLENYHNSQTLRQTWTKSSAWNCLSWIFAFSCNGQTSY